MTNTTTLVVSGPIEAMGDLTLAGIRGYVVQTRLERVDGHLGDRLHVFVRHGLQVVGSGSLRVAAEGDDDVWWGYLTVEGFTWSVCGPRGSGRLEFREDRRLPPAKGDGT